MARTPASLKQLRGTDRRDRRTPRAAWAEDEDEQTQAPEDIVRAPRGTSRAVRKVFAQLVREYATDNLVDEDASLLLAIAEARTFRLQAAEALQAEGLVRDDSQGRAGKSPAWQVWREASEAERRGLAQLHAILRDRRLQIEAGTIEIVRTQASLQANVRQWIDEARQDR